MAVYAEVLDTSFNFPGIDIYQQLKDGLFLNYVARAQESFVFYDTNDHFTETDPETKEEIPVTYYYTLCLFAVNYDMANFSLVAVPRNSVDENYIFGDGGIEAV